MTREQMQSEALAIETLLSAMMTVMSDAHDEDAYGLLDMAQQRAQRLKTALDSVNEPVKLKAQS